jgi:hypothetical protein
MCIHCISTSSKIYLPFIRLILTDKKGEEFMKNVVILPQTLPLQSLQILPVLPLQMCISFVLLSLFRSRGRPIEHGTLITNSIDPLAFPSCSTHAQIDHHVASQEMVPLGRRMHVILRYFQHLAMFSAVLESQHQSPLRSIARYLAER